MPQAKFSREWTINQPRIDHEIFMMLIGYIEQFPRLVNAAYVGFQPMMLPRLDVKTLGFQPIRCFENQMEMSQESLIPTSECT